MPLIEFDGISKTFAGVVALDAVSLAIERGQCHALMGENGAGKSTLGKILAGIYRADAGTLRIDGEPVRFGSPREAAKAGVGMVHQELAFCPNLSVAENLCLGRYPGRLQLVSRRAMRSRASSMLAQIGVGLDVDQRMSQLSTAQEQMVQIAAAVGSRARILVFDEPTSSLSERESQQLFELVGQLKQREVTMIYVSHRLPEVFELCDRISVLRDGQHVGTLDRAEATQDRVVQLMIGRQIETHTPGHLQREPGRCMLRVERLSSPGRCADVSFEVRAGEVVGMAGLVGSGRSELAQAIFGLDPRATGRVELDGQLLPPGKPRVAIRRGLGYVPEDRKRQGLMLKLSGRVNFSLQILDRLRWMGLLNLRAEAREATRYFEQLRVKTPSIETPVAGLSGGNQQKVVLAKWLAARLKVLIVDEPTRGVDVGAKAAIHQLIDELAQQGLAVVLISSDLPEVLSLSSRVLVMREGRLAGELPRAEATQEAVLRLMAGVQSAVPQEVSRS